MQSPRLVAAPPNPLEEPGGLVMYYIVMVEHGEDEQYLPQDNYSDIVDFMISTSNLCTYIYHI